MKRIAILCPGRGSYTEKTMRTLPAGHPWVARADELRSRTKAFNVTTDALLIGTIAAAAVTGVIYLTRPEKERAPAPAPLAAFLKGVSF